jgi:hypothetical protein
MYRLPVAADLLASMHRDAQTARVKGIEREIAAHALRLTPGRGGHLKKERANGTEPGETLTPLARRTESPMGAG